MLEICIVGGDSLFFKMDSVWTAIILAAMVLAIFAAVTAITYRQDNRMCSQMNQALDSIRNAELIIAQNTIEKARSLQGIM